jgi:6-phosphogluconolactonase (cycloisomerase 2 family)
MPERDARRLHTARALTVPTDIAVSPDGTSVYTVAWESDAVAIFRRDPTTGGLSQLAGQQGCVSLHGSDGACIDGVAPENPNAVAVSPDSKSVYVTTDFGPLAGILIFDRDRVTGELARSLARRAAFWTTSTPRSAGTASCSSLRSTWS